MKKPCPNCANESELNSTNPYRPFCSERCRLIDLGDWLTEKNSLPEEEFMDSNIDKENTLSKH